MLKVKNLKNSYVFIEKPIHVNPEKIQKLKKFKNENNLKIFVACNLRFNKVYDIFKKFLNKSPLGKINYVIVKSSLNIKDFHNYENCLHVLHDKFHNYIFCLDALHQNNIFL